MIRAAVVILALLLARPAAAQGTVDLRATARIPEGTRATLATIATLRGPEAEALASTPIGAAAADSISLDDVRTALDATGRINWGRLALSGSTCRLIRTSATPTAPSPPTPQAQPSQDVTAARADQIRSLIAQRLAALLSAEPDDLRLSFDDADRELLDTAIGPGRSVEMNPVGNSDRMPVAVTIYQGERPVTSRTVRVAVLVRRTVPVAQNALRRGEAIDTDDYKLDTQWVGPTLRAAPADRLEGLAVRTHLVPGRVILAADVEPPIIVDKGDIVDVRVVAGSVILKTRGRATTDGRQDQVIEFRALDSKRTFLARIDGPGLAVAVSRSDAAPDDAPPASRDNADTGPATVTKPGLSVTRTNPPPKPARKEKSR